MRRTDTEYGAVIAEVTVAVVLITLVALASLRWIGHRVACNSVRTGKVIIRPGGQGTSSGSTQLVTDIEEINLQVEHCASIGD